MKISSSLLKPLLGVLSIASVVFAVNSFFHSGPYFAVKRLAASTLTMFSATYVDFWVLHNLFDLVLFLALSLICVYEIMVGLETSLMEFYRILFVFFLPELLGFSEVNYFNLLNWADILRVERDFGAVLIDLLIFMLLFTITLTVQDMERVHSGYLANGVEPEVLRVAERRQIGVILFLGASTLLILLGIVLVTPLPSSLFASIQGLVPYRYAVYAGVAVLLLLAGLLIYFRERAIAIIRKN